MQLGRPFAFPAARTNARSSASSLAPASPVSENPAEITEKPRTPFWAHSAATPRTALAGTAIKARSTESGMSRTLV